MSNRLAEFAKYKRNLINQLYADIKTAEYRLSSVTKSISSSNIGSEYTKKLKESKSTYQKKITSLKSELEKIQSELNDKALYEKYIAEIKHNSEIAKQKSDRKLKIKMEDIALLKSHFKKRYNNKSRYNRYNNNNNISFKSTPIDTKNVSYLQKPNQNQTNNSFDSKYDFIYNHRDKLLPVKVWRLFSDFTIDAWYTDEEIKRADEQLKIPEQADKIIAYVNQYLKIK